MPGAVKPPAVTEELGDATPFEHKRLSKPFVPQLTEEKGTFTGHGAVFEDLHPTSSYLLGPEWKDNIRHGAFTRSLAEHKKRGTMPLMLYMHERGYVIGAWQSIEEDKDGLKVAGQVSMNARAPSNVPVYELLTMGGINGLSIGFKPTKVELDQESKVRSILDVELGEISVVDIPGGPRARVTDVKSGDPRNAQVLEAALRDAGLSRKEAKALMANGFTALRDVAADDEPTPRDADRSAGSKDPAALADSIRKLIKTIRRT
jgi:HK97 family phage prohead protease